MHSHSNQLIRRTVTIVDIAREAGVAHPPVPRALRDNPLISSDVRAQILRLAFEMGDIPSAVAQTPAVRAAEPPRTPTCARCI